MIGISHIDPFAESQTIHFGKDNCLVGLSIANTAEHKINSIKFWYQEFDFKDQKLQCSKIERNREITIGVVILSLACLTMFGVYYKFLHFKPSP